MTLSNAANTGEEKKKKKRAEAKVFGFVCLFLGHKLVPNLLMPPCWTHPFPASFNIPTSGCSQAHQPSWWHLLENSLRQCNVLPGSKGKRKIEEKQKTYKHQIQKRRMGRRCCSLWRVTKLSSWGGGLREWLGGCLSDSQGQPITAGKDRLVLLCLFSFGITELSSCIRSRNKRGTYQ